MLYIEKEEIDNYVLDIQGTVHVMSMGFDAGACSIKDARGCMNVLELALDQMIMRLEKCAEDMESYGCRRN